jgi:methanogenic corrinoid protein MtbC1
MIDELPGIEALLRAIGAIRGMGGKPPFVIVVGSPFAVFSDLWPEIGADATALDSRVGARLVEPPPGPESPR